MLGSCVNSWQSNACGWSLFDLWYAMGWLSRADVIFLAIMLVDTAVIVCQRLYRYRTAAKQSREFIRDAAMGLRDGEFDEVISVALRTTQSHVAAIVGAGLTAFIAAPPQFANRETIEISERAMHRTSKTVVSDLNRGLGTLATIASSAPFIGLLGTCFGIMNAFRGIGMEKWTAIAMVMSFLGEALITTAMGLLVAVPALGCYNYLRNRENVMQSEMTNAALETITYLNTHHNFRNQVGRLAPGVSSARGKAYDFPFRYREAPYDHQRALLVPMWCSALFLAYILMSAAYHSYSWQGSYDSAKVEYVPGEELVSPDHRYRALVSPVYREQVNSGADSHIVNWSCAGIPTAVRIVPNDRPLSWNPHVCGKETKYALEGGEALLMSECDIPTITWRTTEELLVQCNHCSAGMLQEVEDDSLHSKMIVLDGDGRRVHPVRVHPQPECFP
jgi:biopolymer transport protein ExbB/TolQ